MNKFGVDSRPVLTSSRVFEVTSTKDNSQSKIVSNHRAPKTSLADNGRMDPWERACVSEVGPGWRRWLRHDEKKVLATLESLLNGEDEPFPC